MKPTLFIALALTLVFSHQAKADDLTRADLSIFFEHIYFVDGQWEFKFSSSSRGMLWRMRNDDSDVTGVCTSGQVLTVKPSSSLEIKRKDLDLILSPRGPVRFWARLTLKPDPMNSDAGDYKEAFLNAKGAGFGLVHARD